MKLEHYRQIAKLFDFPGPEYVATGAEVHATLREGYPDAEFELKQFLAGIPSETLAHQELFTRTFDVQAITTLDVGYVLFGDDYKRAELLSNLTRTHILVGTDCKGELGDHLPNILRLIPSLPEAEGEEILFELVSEILVPALMLMVREFDSGRIEKKNALYEKHFKTVIDCAPGKDATIYQKALMALLLVLKKDFEVGEIITRSETWPKQSKTVDFLGEVVKELEIETTANPSNSGCDS
ncbi:MAG: hypothetical protein LDLANPLL_02229 [Turneriella sp.]|nr:hypothetical protein [Turneriella sp.]